jgi:hypothetical protein
MRDLFRRPERPHLWVAVLIFDTSSETLQPLLLVH